MQALQQYPQNLCPHILTLASPGFLTVADIKGPPRRIGATHGCFLLHGEVCCPSSTVSSQGNYGLESENYEEDLWGAHSGGIGLQFSHHQAVVTHNPREGGWNEAAGRRRSACNERVYVSRR
jgi:hypothetical protein